MAYDQGLAEHIRDLLTNEPGLVEKKMFGGVGFMVGGNMVCGVLKDALVVRANPSLEQTHTRPFEMGGKASKSWVLVDSEGLASDQHLKQWVEHGLKISHTLPAK